MTAFFENWRYNFWRECPCIQVTAAWLQPDMVSASAVLGLGPDLEFLAAPVLVEVPAGDAHDGGS